MIEDTALGNKMRFIAGPRQCGKTTLARAILERHTSGDLLFNWDVPETRSRYRADTFFYRAPAKGKRQPWMCFDEIHKQRQWKNVLKGIYDADGHRFRILVNGSARLDLFRRAGDSLAGRFFLFHLSPVLLGELLGQKPPLAPTRDARRWIDLTIEGFDERASERDEAFDQLWLYGPFPEPLLRARPRFSNLWRRNYLDAVIREDLRDLSRLPDLDTAEELLRLLPSRIGAPLSANALREDLEVSHDAVVNVIRHLERLLVVLAVRPYALWITRPVKKARKLYLYEWSVIPDDAARFENLVAVELQGRTRLWSDSGRGEFDLAFVRDRAGKESDFLILRDQKPWCLIECKLRRRRIESHHRRFAARLGGLPVLQLVREHGVLEAERREAVTMSAARFLA